MNGGNDDEMYPSREAFGLGVESLESGGGAVYPPVGMRERRVGVRATLESRPIVVDEPKIHDGVGRARRLREALGRIARRWLWERSLKRLLFLLLIPLVAVWRWFIEPPTRPLRRCLGAVWRRSGERRELLMAAYEREFEPAAHSLWRRRYTLLRLCGCCWSALSVLGYALTYAGSESLASSARGAIYVRAGEPGVNLSLASLPLTCTEIRSGLLDLHGGSVPDGSPDSSLARLMVAANDALSSDETLPCVCAPMFGKRRRHLAVRAQNASITHFYNPVLETDSWWLREQRSAPAFMIMSERQNRLFPERTESVENVRMRVIRLRYHTADACARAVAELRDDRAYCAQQCLDLLDGVSVYERAARATRSEELE